MTPALKIAAFDRAIRTLKAIDPELPMLSDALASWRKERNLTQAQAAALLGIGRRSLTKYETGIEPVPLSVAKACVAVSLELTAAAS